MPESVQSVSQLIHEIKDMLEGSFQQILVKGEVSNLSSSSTGHWYFTLSDPLSNVSCALFKMDAMRNPTIRKLKDGDQITVSGSIGLYSKRGTFQIIVRKIIFEGQGSLKEEFEKLKKKIAKEGLFDLDKKKPIPLFPKKIAIVTALGGAALQDFLNVMMRRSFEYHLVIIPCLVQGDTAPKSIISALEKVERVGDFDLVVLTRGGGSIEDLWAFNDEGLARKIFSLKIPVVSAVGHQVDFTLSDFVSDRRCETPSAAAEVISQPQLEFSKELEYLNTRLKPILNDKLYRLKDQLSEVSPFQVLSIIKNNHLAMVRKLEKLNLKNREHELVGIHEHQFYLEELIKRMIAQIQVKFDILNSNFNSKNEMLRVLNPSNILERGYSYVSDEKGRVIDSLVMFDKIKNEQVLNIRFNDGTGKVKKL